jgi:hypothetical protein
LSLATECGCRIDARNRGATCAPIGTTASFPAARDDCGSAGSGGRKQKGEVRNSCHCGGWPGKSGARSIPESASKCDLCCVQFGLHSNPQPFKFALTLELQRTEVCLLAMTFAQLLAPGALARPRVGTFCTSGAAGPDFAQRPRRILHGTPAFLLALGEGPLVALNFSMKK